MRRAVTEVRSFTRSEGATEEIVAPSPQPGVPAATRIRCREEVPVVAVGRVFPAEEAVVPLGVGIGWRDPAEEGSTGAREPPRGPLQPCRRWPRQAGGVESGRNVSSRQCAMQSKTGSLTSRRRRTAISRVLESRRHRESLQKSRVLGRDRVRAIAALVQGAYRRGRCFFRFFHESQR